MYDAALRPVAGSMRCVPRRATRHGPRSGLVVHQLKNVLSLSNVDLRSRSAARNAGNFRISLFRKGGRRVYVIFSSNKSFDDCELCSDSFDFEIYF